MKQMHVLGRAPMIRDGEVVLAKPGAIFEYTLARYGEARLAVAPAEPNFARYRYWLHYAERSLILQLLREWSLDGMQPDADGHPGKARVRKGTRTRLGMIEAALTGSPYFAGDDFTAADVMMACPFATFQLVRRMNLAPYPAIRAYVQRLEPRPAFRRAKTPV